MKQQLLLFFPWLVVIHVAAILYCIMLRKRKHNAATTALHYRDVLVREPSKFFLPFKCITVSLFLVLKAETHENLTVSVSLDFRTSPLSPYELNAALVRHALR